MNASSGRRYFELAHVLWIRASARLPAEVMQTLGILVLLLVFVAVNTVTERLTHLPGQSYSQSSIVAELFRRIGLPLALSIAAAASALARFGHLLARWDNLEFGGTLRVFVLVLALTITWPLATAGYNYYFDQGYVVEKVMLIALLPLVWWRPLFIYPLIALAYLLLWQFVEPALGGTVLAHKLQVLRALNLFAAAFLVYAATGNRSSFNFLVLICCFVAAAYWLPAVAKLNLAWLREDQLYLAPMSAYAHGWLAFLSSDRIVEISQHLRTIDTVMKLFVIVVEGLCLFFLWRRWLSIGLLATVIVFHIGVFAMYGFLFWTWIMLDLALLMLIIKTTGNAGPNIFNWQTCVVSVVLIAFGSIWAKPPELGWYETPLTYTYRVEAIDERGERLQIHPAFFSPYEDSFTMSSFAYLVRDRSVLVETYGVTLDRKLMHALINSRTAGEIFEIEKSSSRIRYNQARSARLREFLERFIANRVARGERAGWVRALRAPQQFWSFRGEYPIASEIREIALVEVTSLYDGERLQDIRRRELARFPPRRNFVE